MPSYTSWMPGVVLSTTPISPTPATGTYHGGNTYDAPYGVSSDAYSGVELPSGSGLGWDILSAAQIQAVSSGMIGEVSGMNVYQYTTKQGTYTEGSGFMTLGEDVVEYTTPPAQAWPSGYI